MLLESMKAGGGASATVGAASELPIPLGNSTWLALVLVLALGLQRAKLQPKQQKQQLLLADRKGASRQFSLACWIARPEPASFKRLAD